MQLKKLKGGDEVLPPANQLHKALYTLKFLGVYKLPRTEFNTC
jgi:hypothetical protein